MDAVRTIKAPRAGNLRPRRDSPNGRYRAVRQPGIDVGREGGSVGTVLFNQCCGPRSTASPSHHSILPFPPTGGCRPGSPILPRRAPGPRFPGLLSLTGHDSTTAGSSARAIRTGAFTASLGLNHTRSVSAAPLPTKLSLWSPTSGATRAAPSMLSAFR